MLTPPPDLTVSEWADQNRRLSSEASAEPGRWRTDRAPYQRGIMDSFNEPVDTIVFMKSAQVGATEVLNNILGYCIEHQPSPCLILQPTIEMGSAWSKDRLSAMLRDTPCLQDKVGDRRSRDSDNTILHKIFPGGHLTIAGANSPASLASRPIRVCLADEVDRYPASAGSEGDPLSLAFKRTTTFSNRKRYVCSTPTVAGESRIEAAFEESDKRFYWVPCPHCDEFQRLKWSNVTWDKGKPQYAYYACDHCGGVITDTQKVAMLRGGEWRAEKETLNVAGFHISEIYSPWVTFGEMAVAFLEAKKNTETLKTWTNTALGECWTEQGDELSASNIYRRAASYDKAPEDVLCLTCAVDVQDDRLEAEVKGWGVQEESWTLSHDIFYGDPGRLELWKRLSEHLRDTFETQDGRKLRIACTVIDSGGHYTDAVYRFVKANGGRTYAIKGVGGPGRPVIGRPSKANKAGVTIFPVGVDTAKEILFGRLKIETPGAGYMHFPDSLDEEYFLQLASEKRVRTVQRGVSTYKWTKVRRRNEAWDLNVYQIAAFDLLNPNLSALAKRLEPEVVPEEPKPDTRQRIRRQSRRKKGFVHNW